MNHSRQHNTTRFLKIAIVVMCGWLLQVIAEEPQSLEQTELKLALKALQKENQELKGKLEKANEKVATFGKALASANTDAERVRIENSSLRQEMQALGVSTLDPTAQGIRNRLKEALATLNKERQHSEELTAQLFQLTSATEEYLKGAITGNMEAEQYLVEALKHTTSAIGITNLLEENNEDQTKMSVIATREDLELIVLNSGTENGTRIGMPVRLFRKDRPFGEAIIVDVRKKVSGAVIQSLTQQNDSPQVGDFALLDPNSFQ